MSLAVFTIKNPTAIENILPDTFRSAFLRLYMHLFFTLMEFIFCRVKSQLSAVKEGRSGMNNNEPFLGNNRGDTLLGGIYEVCC